jgi:tetratricopeptide (TPR) repeat protein
MNGLIGRDQELALCLEQLRRPRALVVLFGPPGVGKTALAEQVVCELERRGQAVVRKPQRAATARASVLWLDEPTREKALSSVRQHAGATLLSRRTRLGLAQEVLVPLRPWLAAGGGEALQFLLARSRALSLSIAAEDHAVLEQIAAWLGGLPANLELAVHALRTHSPGQLLSRLESEHGRLALARALDLPAEHRSTQRLAAAALGALSKAARRSVTALAYLSQPFSRAQAEQVLGDADSVEALLEELMDCGLCVTTQRDAALWFALHPYLLASAQHGPLAMPALLNVVKLLAQASERTAAGEDELARLAALAGHSAFKSPRTLEARLELGCVRAGALYRLGRLREAADALPPVSAMQTAPRSSRAAAKALQTVAVIERKARRFEAARQCAVAASARWSALDPKEALFADGALASIELERGEWSLAEQLFSDILRRAREYGLPRYACLARGGMGHTSQEAGKYAEAQTHYRAAYEGFAAQQDQRLAAVYLGYEGTALEEQGLFERALELYRKAIPALSAAGANDFASLFGACARALAAELGEPVPHSEPASSFDDPALLAAVRLHQLRAELATPRAAALTADTHLRDVSDDVRFALRRLARARAAQRQDGVRLCVGDGSFTLEGQASVDLRSRRVLWRLFERILAAHLESPGRAVSSADLARAAWGDERMLERARAHRLRVALSELRKRGLAEILLRTPAGLSLAEHVVVVWGG